MPTLPTTTTLLLIDLQQAVDHPSWGPRNNPEAEKKAGLLLTEWRRLGLPIIHIRHDSTEPGSTYRPGQPGNIFKQEVMPAEGETVLAKHTNSAFIGTGLELMLRRHEFLTLVVVGVSSNNSVDATVRMAGNLGFTTYLVEGATFAFDKKDWSGRYRPAQEVHDMELANLHGEYCTVVSADWVKQALAD